jgi:CheY-like chemotaxis protein
VFGSKRQQPSQSQSVPRHVQEDAGEEFRQCLRAVDGFIKKGELAKARARLEDASKLEPNNPYLKAFDERLRYLEKNPDALTSPEKNPPGIAGPATRQAEIQSLLLRSQEDALRRRIEEDYRERFTSELRNAESNAARTLEEFEHTRSKSLQAVKQEFERAYQTQISEERKRLKEEAEAVIDAERRKLQEQYDLVVAQHNNAVKEVREELRRNLEQTLYRRLEQISREYDDKLEMLGATVPSTPEEKTLLYHRRMSEYYADGQPTVVNAQRLMRLKELLELTFDEHLEIEAAVRLELYTESLKRKTLSGEITIRNKKKLEELRKQFGITKEQEKSISTYITSSLKKGKSKARLLVVDDDEALLRLLKSYFAEHDYTVSIATDVESAMAKLQEAAVDLILCDIKFPEGDLDGFRLFSSLQEFPHLRKIPFIFMSALRDGLVMRSGFQLGVDDYVTKPLDLDLLESIIEGRLKRFQSLALL